MLSDDYYFSSCNSVPAAFVSIADDGDDSEEQDVDDKGEQDVDGNGEQDDDDKGEQGDDDKEEQDDDNDDDEVYSQGVNCAEYSNINTCKLQS